MNIKKQDISFCADSFDNHTNHTLKSATFLKDLLDFSANEKDNINEETVELLEPYLKLALPNGEPAFTKEIAKNASAALGGMCE